MFGLARLWRVWMCPSIDPMLIGGAIAGPLITGLFASEGQQQANETNIQLGREQMAFQERMSGTSYQRAVQSMKDAGLNPMLAYSQGGASTPVGAMPQVQNVAGAGVNSAAAGMGMANALQQIMQSGANTKQMEAMTEKIKSETMERNLNTARLAAEIEQVKSSKKNLDATADNTQQAILGTIADSAAKHATFTEMNKGGFAADVAKRKAEAQLSQLEIPGAKASARFFESDMGAVNPYLRQILEVLRGVTAATRR